MKAKEWFKTAFTLDGLKASGPIWKALFKSKFNWMMIIILAIIVASGWKIGDEAGTGITFLSTWLFWHRYIVAYKNLQIKELIEGK